ncbi:LLM class F420-dependent oxidoreductase [Streptomyces zagrosensis]|uniref:Putative F420-dependent oxidoreductase n=1 Tax=Streptomyces zagrosensis TaxID=1042984 RepID=A0A7W9Q698_9ACTN|nr:LLM class F420-dependent oxidoreductase [Streptomyces zagrosensis]MBB5934281.1 putative F420-dependent oxidoreductase [Streptomyces zagrosensis]
MAFNERLGRVGIWSMGLRADDPARNGEVGEAAAELEELGYGTLWIGGSPSIDQAVPLLASTSRIAVGTSILSIWQHTAAAVAARHAEVNAAYDGRFVLGLGVSHDEIAQKNDHPLANRPYTALKEYLTALDTAPIPVPADQRALAALGPKMLELSRDRALGALPYLVTPEHTAAARATLGPDAVLAPEFKVVLDADLDRARATARDYLRFYLSLTNYTKNFLSLGFTDEDFADGGSNRLLDAVFALGDVEVVRQRTEEFRAAGADHVAVQVVTANNDNANQALPRAEWRALAEALPLAN